MRLILRRMLTEMGMDVEEASDGLDGLAQLTDGLTPNLILVDWHMPQLAGIDFVAAIRKPPFDYPGRVVMVTTETELTQIARALDVGADEYLMKPFTKEALSGKLALLGLGS
jgi:two-component system chemotaxis response regulator CheY